MLLERLEPTKRGFNKRKEDVLTASIPNWLPLQDVFRTLDWKEIKEKLLKSKFIKAVKIVKK